MRVYHVTGPALEIYLSVCQRRGQPAGDIKLVVLHHLSGWSEAFPGYMVGPAF